MKDRLTPEEFLSLARSLPVDERTPYAFERRIMARLRDLPGADALSDWTHALWRAMAPCLGIMLLAAVVSFAVMGSDPGSESDGDLEATVFAPTRVAFDVTR
jgi:hypothetical protein